MKKTFNGKAIYNPSGKAGEYSYWACNFYLGCSNGCTYCFLKKGRGAAILGGSTPTLKKCFKDKKHALEIFEKELIQNKAELQKHGLFFSFTTDPLLSECNDLTWGAIMFAMEYEIPAKILTKVASKAFITLVEAMPDSWKPYLAIGFTLTGRDDLEPNASSNADRITCMKALHKAGFKTFASIEPIVDFESSLKMIQSINGFCDLYKIGLMSGGKYDKKELQSFICKVLMKPQNEINEEELTARKMLNLAPHKAIVTDNKIYFKDSLLKKAGVDRCNLPYNCVDRDYNMFND